MAALALISNDSHCSPHFLAELRRRVHDNHHRMPDTNMQQSGQIGDKRHAMAASLVLTIRHGGAKSSVSAAWTTLAVCHTRLFPQNTQVLSRHGKISLQ